MQGEWGCIDPFDQFPQLGSMARSVALQIMGKMANATFSPDQPFDTAPLIKTLNLMLTKAITDNWMIGEVRAFLCLFSALLCFSSLSALSD